MCISRATGRQQESQKKEKKRAAIFSGWGAAEIVGELTERMGKLSRELEKQSQELVQLKMSASNIRGFCGICCDPQQPVQWPTEMYRALLFTRIYQVPEGSKDNMANILRQLIKKCYGRMLEIERLHRSLGLKPANYAPPLWIIDYIVKQAWAQKRVAFKEIYFDQYYSLEVQKGKLSVFVLCLSSLSDHSKFTLCHIHNIHIRPSNKWMTTVSTEPQPPRRRKCRFVG